MSALVPKLVFVDPKTSVPDDPVRPLDKEHLFDLEQQLRYDPQHTPCIGYYHEGVLHIVDGLHRRHVLIKLDRPMMVLAFDEKPPQDYIDRLKLTPQLVKRNLDPLSIFYAVTAYCEEHGVSLRQAAEIFRFDTSIISKYRYLLDLPEEAQGFVRNRTLPADTGIAIAKGFKDNPEEMLRLAKEAVAGRLTAKTVRELAAEKNGTAKEEFPKITWPKGWVAKQKAEWHLTESKKHGGK